MNNLLSASFSRLPGGEASPPRGGAGSTGDGHFDIFFEDVNSVKEDLNELDRLNDILCSCHEQSKTIIDAKTVKDLLSRMEVDVRMALKKAHMINGKLQAIDRANAANRNLPDCGPGSASDRSRTSIVNSFRNKLKDSMYSVIQLMELISSESETFQKRYFDVKDGNPDEEIQDRLISTEESEILAMQEPRRGRVLDTVDEIQERSDAVKDIEKDLRELHQVFLTMSVLVERQGTQLDDIESHVDQASSFIRGGTEQLHTARVYQKNTRNTCYKLACYAIIILFLIIITISVILLVRKP